MSWNSEAPGNPSFRKAAEMTEAAVMGGVAEDTTLLKGTPDDVSRAVQTALADTGGQRALIAAGCSVDPRTPPDNLAALRDAAWAWRA
jgi:uroporphyrinogen-III decarboxylase